uniref:Cyclin-like domain-containing protein n=1 Tax=Spongospora subterranea TaxID=70186 RepID=A0A0H5RMC7_9EUKA|eukprot:CRZ09874.1 hypothetical protein [Spongospora subterranea]
MASETRHDLQHARTSGRRPLFSKEQIQNSPSRKIGISADLESRLRHYCVSFMSDVAKMLNLKRSTLATASTLIQHFYMSFPFDRLYNKYQVISACICLAGKLEEQRCTVQQIAKAVLYHRHKVKPDRSSTQFTDFQNGILSIEILLLQAIRFNLYPSHPHDLLNRIVEFAASTNEQGRILLDLSSRFINDSLKTPASLMDSSETIAVACVHMAIIWMNMGLPSEERLNIDALWYTDYDKDISPSYVERVCQLILNILEHPLTSSSPSKDNTRKRKPTGPNTPEIRRHDAMSNQLL